MSENSSSTVKGTPELKPTAHASGADAHMYPRKKRSSKWLLVGLPLWIVVSFLGGQLVIVAVSLALQAVGVSFEQVNEAVFSAAVAAASYVVSLAIALGVPWWTRRRRTTRQEMGLQRLPSWLDIGITPVAFIGYMIISSVMVFVVTQLVSGFDATQAQSIGFSDLTHGYQYVLAFITLVVLAPFAEEALFRGYLQGKLRKIVSFWPTAIVVSGAFAALHLPGDGVLQWNVAVDVFMLSMVLCLLREKTGSLWASILLHMCKNGLAYYFLFINPTLLSTIGG